MIYTGGQHAGERVVGGSTITGHGTGAGGVQASQHSSALLRNEVSDPFPHLQLSSLQSRPHTRRARGPGGLVLAPPGTASAAVNARPRSSSTHNTRAGSDRLGRLPRFGIRGTWHRGDGRGGEEEEERRKGSTGSFLGYI